VSDVSGSGLLSSVCESMSASELGGECVVSPAEEMSGNGVLRSSLFGERNLKGFTSASGARGVGSGVALVDSGLGIATDRLVMPQCELTVRNGGLDSAFLSLRGFASWSMLLENRRRAPPLSLLFPPTLFGAPL
jgi:hypothetical protein